VQITEVINPAWFLTPALRAATQAAALPTNAMNSRRFMASPPRAQK
jgi:hypothetical protein